MQIKKVLEGILQWTWELPQNIAGGVIAIAFRDKAMNKMNDGTEQIFHHWRYGAGLSLGGFRFVSYNTSQDTMNHEYGHTRQSHILGPLYLLAIGLPSIIWCGLRNVSPYLRRWSYYAFYTESWADRLGGVKRG